MFARCSSATPRTGRPWCRCVRTLRYVSRSQRKGCAFQTAYRLEPPKKSVPELRTGALFHSLYLSENVSVCLLGFSVLFCLCLSVFVWISQSRFVLCLCLSPLAAACALHCAEAHLKRTSLTCLACRSHVATTRVVGWQVTSQHTVIDTINLSTTLSLRVEDTVYTSADATSASLQVLRYPFLINPLADCVHVTMTWRIHMPMLTLRVRICAGSAAPVPYQPTCRLRAPHHELAPYLCPLSPPPPLARIHALPRRRSRP